jgi:disulfide bond formation protein DsbB
MNDSSRNRRAFLFVLLGSTGLVSGGIVLAELFHLAACPLCIIQRALYLALSLVAAVGVAVAARPVASHLVALLLAVVAATGVCVAGYQVWLQRFAPSTNCSPFPSWWEEMVDWAGEQVPVLFKASGLCSDPAWKFLGLSIAEWSLGCFVVFLLVALRALIRKR